MPFTLAGRETDPHDAFATEPAVVPAARENHAPLELLHDILSRSEAPQTTASAAPLAGAASPAVDTTFRPTNVNPTQDNARLPGGRASGGRWAGRALFAFLLAIAAMGWQQYGDAAQQAIANWMPQFALAAPSPPVEKPGAGPTNPTAAEPSATDQATAQPAPPSAPGVASSDVAAPPVEPAQMQSMARDLASMGQQIEALKATIEQLRAGQEQISRDVARASEIRTSAVRPSAAMPSGNTPSGNTPSGILPSTPGPRPRIVPPPPRSAVAPPRRPRPAFAYSPPPAAAAPPPQAAAAPPPPLEPQAQATARPGDEPIIRPPMPVR